MLGGNLGSLLYGDVSVMKAVHLMWFSVLLVSPSVSVLFARSMCLSDIYLGLGSL